MGLSKPEKEIRHFKAETLQENSVSDFNVFKFIVGVWGGAGRVDNIVATVVTTNDDDQPNITG